MTDQSHKFQSAMAAYNADQCERALQLMEECGSEGNPTACYLVALWYRNGEGAPKDAQRSRQWIDRLLRIANEGDIIAQWNVGQSYRFGDLLPLDIKRANEWLERAAENGSGDAQHHLAWYYEHGLYEYPNDPAQAAKWYQRAFDQEHPETLYLYATKLFRDGRPTEEAVSLLKKAAAKGFKQAEYLLQSSLH
jgi:uncharacterized protein